VELEVVGRDDDDARVDGVEAAGVAVRAAGAGEGGCEDEGKADAEDLVDENASGRASIRRELKQPRPSLCGSAPLENAQR
jgi:hypothetical protein